MRSEMSDEERLTLEAEMHRLNIEHRDLDAAIADYSRRERRFGLLIDFDAEEARIFLYRRGEVDASGILNLGTGALAMAITEEKTLSTLRAAAQKRAAVSRIRRKK